MSPTSPPPDSALPWLVLGASGAVGRGLLARIAAAQPPQRTLAWSRRAPPGWTAALGAIEWQCGDLERDRLTEPVTTVLSAGPLDRCVAWLERGAASDVRRIVALSSTSLHAKAASPDAAERALAARLDDAERRLAAWCGAHAAHWTVLRPTLIYGGDDRTLARIATLARRLGVFALPTGARGRRQPVHADDVAQAMLAALVAGAARDRAYDLPGGETLDYETMVRRVLAAQPRPPRLLRVPAPLFAAAAALLRLLPAFRGASPAVLARLEQDLVFDAGDAIRDFGYAPRAFAPEASTAGRS